MGLILPGQAVLPAQRGLWLWAGETASGVALLQHGAFCPGWWEMSRLEQDVGGAELGCGFPPPSWVKKKQTQNPTKQLSLVRACSISSQLPGWTGWCSRLPARV